MGDDDDEQSFSDGCSKMPEYEKRRMKTIEENRKRMEALGLKKMAISLSATSKQVLIKKKGKAKMVDDDDDDEYKPPSESESEQGRSDATVKKNNKKTKNSVKSSQKPKRDSLCVDDNQALMQAIALSLKDTAGFIDAKKSASQSSTPQVDPAHNERNINSQTPEDAEKRKRKKTTGSRVQMKEDELIMYFYQFDELGKGSITLRDLQRVAAAHDFTWSDKEMADMIHYFDSDGDGKLNLDDLGKIADRCNMVIQ